MKITSLFNIFFYPRSLSEAETALSVEEKEEDSALSFIYASLYKRDYYVQMNKNKNTDEGTKATQKQPKKEVGKGKFKDSNNNQGYLAFCFIKHQRNVMDTYNFETIWEYN